MIRPSVHYVHNHLQEYHTITNTQLLIDGDLWLFRASAASEFECDWGDDVWVLSSNLDQAKDMFRSLVDATARELASNDLVFVLSGDKNFRYTLDPSYKSNRKGTRKPIVYRELIDWLRGEYPGRVVSKPCLEADDYLGILSTTPGVTDTRVIVSEDKDLQTIPGKLYRKGELIEITEEEANYYWMYQTLTGDPTDGYKGCPGVGPVKAKAILAKPGSPWENVRQTFLRAGLTEEDAFLQASLSHICRFEDWCSATQSVKPLVL